MNRYQTLATTSGILVFILMLFDGLVRIAGETIGCRAGWYFCAPSPSPAISWISALEYGQRATAVAFVVALSLLLLQGWRFLGVSRLLFSLPLFGVALAALYATLLIVSGGAESTVTRTLVAQILFALLIVAALVAVVRNAGIEGNARSGSGLDKLAGASAIAVLGLIVAGTVIALGDGSIACGAWPLCEGRVIPTGFSAVDLHLTHRWVALFATAGIFLSAQWARRVHAKTPTLRGLTNAAAVLMTTQIFIGAATVWTQQSAITSAAHLGVAGVIWGVLVSIAVLDRLLPVTEPVSVPSIRPVARQIFADYLALTKPRIMVLLLITTLGAMLIAAAGFPSLSLILWTMLGGALSAGGASALNHYLDRDIDGLMSRTRRRPVPGGRVAPVQVAIFGVTSSISASGTSAT